MADTNYLAVMLLCVSWVGFLLTFIVLCLTIRNLEKSRDFLYFAYDLVHKDFGKEIAAKLAVKLAERHKTYSPADTALETTDSASEKPDSEYQHEHHAVGGTD